MDHLSNPFILWTTTLGSDEIRSLFSGRIGIKPIIKTSIHHTAGNCLVKFSDSFLLSTMLLNTCLLALLLK